jgi:ElaB/YqjD/DUF883 family membrane-anchored ribosome-binding protein
MDETRTASTATPTTGGTSTTTATGTAGGAEMVDRMKQSAHQAVDRVAAAAAPAVEKLRASATSAAQTLQARADQFGAMEEQWVANARNMIREHPLTSVAIGVLVGMLIGRSGGHGRRDE